MKKKISTSTFLQTSDQEGKAQVHYQLFSVTPVGKEVEIPEKVLKYIENSNKRFLKAQNILKKFYEQK